MSLANRFLPGLPLPHRSTPCHRAAGLDMPGFTPGSRPVHLVVDGTG